MKFHFILLLFVTSIAFSQNYLIPADGKTVTVKTCSGKVYDAGGTGAVPENSKGSITIMPTIKGKIIKLELDTLSMGNDTIFFYAGHAQNQKTLIGSPTWVFGKPKLFYGDEKTGAITIRYAGERNPFNKAGFSAKISCIDKAVVFDLTAKIFNVTKKSSGDWVSLYLLIPAQKEICPSVKAEVYYSVDKTLDKSDIYAGDLFFDNLGPNEMNVNVDQPIPAGLKKGKYYVICVIDPGHFITETDETNNTVISKEFTY